MAKERTIVSRFIVEDCIVGYVLQVESPDPRLYGGHHEFTDVAWYREKPAANKAVKAIRDTGLVAEVVEAWFPKSTRFADDN